MLWVRVAPLTRTSVRLASLRFLSRVVRLRRLTAKPLHLGAVGGCCDGASASSGGLDAVECSARSPACVAEALDEIRRFHERMFGSIIEHKLTKTFRAVTGNVIGVQWHTESIDGDGAWWFRTRVSSGRWRTES